MAYCVLAEIGSAVALFGLADVLRRGSVTFWDVCDIVMALLSSKRMGF